jgi:V/A-type H+-transporting ATPase subunit I
MMITEMAKVEIAGPKRQLFDVLDLLYEQGIFQPDAQIRAAQAADDRVRLQELLLDRDAASERAFFISLKERVQALLSDLPEQRYRPAEVRQMPAVGVLDELVDKHLDRCRSLHAQRQELHQQAEELARHLRFWSVLEPFIRDVHEQSDLVFFGITIRDQGEVEPLRQLLEQQTNGRCNFTTARVEDGALIGLVTTDRENGRSLRTLLTDKQIPELALPSELSALPFRQKTPALRKRLDDVRALLKTRARALNRFAHRWQPTYQHVLAWLEDRLALYRASGAAYETSRCFLIHGWLARADVLPLQQRLQERFAGQVVVGQLGINHEEFDRVPVLLRNPAWLRPFELLASILPLPKYGSYDPTPFLALTFPPLFGMILGDIGYGLVLLLIAAVLQRLFAEHRRVSDGAHILGVAAAYAILFGLVFGELFGNLGEHWFALQPLWLERSRAVVPMILFAIAVGLGHITLGMLLGIRYDCRRRQTREALVRGISLLIVLLGAFCLTAALPETPWQVNKQLLVAILLLLPLLVITGGVLALLELLKHLGNIISYVRIMAIGLCSVLFAQVANQLGSMVDSLLAAALIATTLHLFNLLLGAFAPTVHALRLHYVEFFGKFLEFGGRRFTPLFKP